MQTSASDHLQSLQLLRAAAALAVVLFHLTFPLEQEFGVLPANVFMMGSDGVDVFFVISGFIMAYTTARQDQRSPVQFIWKRLVRILPLYWVLTMAVFAIGLVAPQLLNSGGATWEELGKSLAFIPYERGIDGSVVPVLFLGWTLNYEMFFYAVFAIALSLMPNRRVLFVVTAISVVAAVGYLSGPNLGVVGRFYTNGIILEFAAGCLLYSVWQERPDLLRWAIPAAVLGVALLAFQNFVELSVPRELKKGLPALMIVAGALRLSAPNTAISRFFSRVGDASYSLYLGHPYAIAVSVKMTVALLGTAGILGAAIAATASLSVAVVAALASFYLFERPANNMLRGLPSKLRPYGVVQVRRGATKARL